MLRFGRACFASGNGDGELPFALVSAHERLARYEGDSDSEEDAYWRHAGVWHDIRAVYEPYLESHADDRTRRSQYARFACLAGEGKIAREQFAQLGERVCVSEFRNQAEYEQLRDRATKRGAR